VYNATGPQDPLGIGALLERCKAVSGSDARFTWADAQFLAEQKVEPWSHMPVWVPPEGEGVGLATVSCAKALGHGLTFRPLDETLRATLDWWQTLPPERRAKLRAGIPREREAEVLAAWHAAHPAAAAKPAKGRPRPRPQAAAG
jgi:2'-hydroxyisoflavone reductase